MRSDCYWGARPSQHTPFAPVNPRHGAPRQAAGSSAEASPRPVGPTREEAGVGLHPILPHLVVRRLGLQGDMGAVQPACHANPAQSWPGTGALAPPSACSMQAGPRAPPAPAARAPRPPQGCGAAPASLCRCIRWAPGCCEPVHGGQTDCKKAGAAARRRALGQHASKAWAWCSTARARARAWSTPTPQAWSNTTARRGARPICQGDDCTAGRRFQQHSLAAHPVQHLMRHLHLPQPHEALQQRGQALRQRGGERRWPGRGWGVRRDSSRKAQHRDRCCIGCRRRKTSRLEAAMCSRGSRGSRGSVCSGRTWGEGRTPMRAMRASTCGRKCHVAPLPQQQKAPLRQQPARHQRQGGQRHGALKHHAWDGAGLVGWPPHSTRVDPSNAAAAATRLQHHLRVLRPSSSVHQQCEHLHQKQGVQPAAAHGVGAGVPHRAPQAGCCRAAILSASNPMSG